MNSKFHLWVSVLKSTVRIVGCIGTLKTGNVWYMALMFLFAEYLGILEELGDKR